MNNQNVLFDVTQSPCVKPNEGVFVRKALFFTGPAYIGIRVTRNKFST